jgi:hypothetical protein
MITSNDNINDNTLKLDNTKYVQGKMITPFNVIIFPGQQMLSFLCHHFPIYILCVIIYVIIFRVLSFMISFDVIIFHGQQMLSFYVIIFPCTYFVLSIWYHDIYIKKNDKYMGK